MSKQNIFTKSQVLAPNRSTFDLSHERMTSFKPGIVVPTMCMEVMPGDTINHKTQQLMRLMPMVSPVMSRLKVKTYSFYVPNRILWDGWEAFIDPTGENPAYPTIPSAGITAGCIGNHLGLPVVPDADGNYPNVSALPIAAYMRIWNHFFRNPSLQEELICDVFDGDDNDNLYNWAKQEPLQKNWGYDYLTSCLPYPQGTANAVTIPVGTDAPLVYDNTPPIGNQQWRDQSGNPAGSGAVNLDNSYMENASGQRINVDVTETTRVDLTQATGTTVSTWRRALKLQEWFELLGRVAGIGGRYKDLIKGFFNVDVGDDRIDEPIYLGGGVSNVSISETLQTSSTDGETPQGNMAGHGINAAQSYGYNYKVREHGWLITVIMVSTPPAYQQGIPRAWSKFTFDMYAWPQFEHIGEQAVYNKEVYTDDSNENEAVFGYIPRYSELKYHPNTVTGQMATTLDYWHLGRKFSTRPYLNDAFVIERPQDYTRIFAVEEGDPIVAHIFHEVSASRPLSYFGNPGL